MPTRSEFLRTFRRSYHFAWADLMRPEFKGKRLRRPFHPLEYGCALVVEAMGEYTYPDKGNMTKAEIDLTMKIFTEAKNRLSPSARAFWSELNESVNHGLW